MLMCVFAHFAKSAGLEGMQVCCCCWPKWAYIQYISVAVLCVCPSSPRQTLPGAETNAQVEPSCQQAYLEGRDGGHKHACTWQFMDAGKIINFIFIYPAMNGFIDYLPRPNCNTTNIGVQKKIVLSFRYALFCYWTTVLVFSIIIILKIINNLGNKLTLKTACQKMRNISGMHYNIW